MTLKEKIKICIKVLLSDEIPPPYYLTHEKNKVDITKIKISKNGEVIANE